MNPHTSGGACSDTHPHSACAISPHPLSRGQVWSSPNPSDVCLFGVLLWRLCRLQAEPALAKKGQCTLTWTTMDPMLRPSPPPCDMTGQTQTPLACAVITEPPHQVYALGRSGPLDVWSVWYHTLALDPRPL